MRPPWLNFVKLFLALLASLLLNLPIFLYENGPIGATRYCLTISAIFVLVAALEVSRLTGMFPRFFADRSFDRRLRIAFISTIPYLIVSVAGGFFPSILHSESFRIEATAAVAGFQFGMFSGLLTIAPYATIDHPRTPDVPYWAIIGIVLGFALGVLLYFSAGQPNRSLIAGGSAILTYQMGLWLGLILGAKVNLWAEALRPTFVLLRRMARTLIAFGVGYLTIIVLFATFFGATWKLEGGVSFSGLPSTPPLSTFLYFSLVTASTVGYGDIAPRSEIARMLAGLELLSSIAWTLVVFAAVAIRFSRVDAKTSSARGRTNLSNSPQSDTEMTAKMPGTETQIRDMASKAKN